MDTEKTPPTLLWFGIPFDVLELFRTASSIIMVPVFPGERSQRPTRGFSATRVKL